MSKIKVRINGRGNAWPVILGQEHAFYDRSNYEDLANASCSIIESDVEKPTKDQINWEILIDAGHGAVQYLIKNCNRIPDAIFLTHPHIDHILGLDWIVQSYYKTHKEKYPVYATKPCWGKVKAFFPQLVDLIEFNELLPFNKINVHSVHGVEVTTYPVYHGPNAVGAAMFLFEIADEATKIKTLFTGDILCPLLRNQDYEKLADLDLIVVDANNRYPYPKSNHWSVVRGIKDKYSKIYKDYIHSISIGTLLYPHLNNQKSDIYSRCFDYFFNTEIHVEDFYFTIKDFIQSILPKKVCFIHYSGSEDEKYYDECILNTFDLKNWLKKELNSGANDVDLNVPYVSQHINFLTY